MKRTEQLDEEGIKTLLSNEIRSSLTYDDTELSSKRSRALEYYRGEMSDTPSLPNRSSVVSRDVADTIGWMLPGIIRVFTASDQMALYEPEKPGDEPFAKQATDYINNLFFKENEGYRILWDGTHDSLLLGNGIIKHWWDGSEEIKVTEHSGVTEEQIALLQSDPEVEIAAQKQGEPQFMAVPDQAGGMVEVPIPTYDVKLKRVVRSGRLRIECIEPEDFLLDREATSIEDARFCAHRRDVTRSDLIRFGFDKELVEGLPADRFSSMRQERISRDGDAGYSFNMAGDNSMMLVELFECYVKADVDGDGIAETIRAFYAGSSGAGELLDWEVWDDDVPFSDIPCEPVPHRWDARSVTDDTLDIQRVKTVLTRQFLDNLYWVNNPMTAAEHESIINPEMLRSPRFGGTVIYKKGSPVPTALPIPFVGDKALLGLQHFDNVREMRTGVSRSTMALDPEALQNQTATANQNQKDSAYSQIELIARNQAELGWKRVFRQILKLTVKHQDRPRVIRLRDEWVEMDPRSWNADMDVTVNIGLGTGSRDRDMAMLNTILSGQIAMTDRLGAAGFVEQALDMVPKINLTLTKLTESAGIKNPEQFFIDMNDETVQRMKQQASAASQKPNPEMQKAQMKIQADAEKAKADMMIAAQKMQAERQLRANEQQMEHERKLAQIDAELQMKREQLNAELAMKRELAYAEMDMKRELGLVSTMANNGGATSGVEPGGEPG